MAPLPLEQPRGAYDGCSLGANPQPGALVHGKHRTIVFFQELFDAQVPILTHKGGKRIRVEVVEVDLERYDSQRGELGQAAFGLAKTRTDRGLISQAILALGRQDIDPDGLEAPNGMEVLGASSDHLLLDTGPRSPAIGSEVMFQLNYSALLRAMTSPFVALAISEGDGKAEGRSLASGGLAV